MDFILYLVLILLATKLAGHLSLLLGQPAVLGKLLAGVLLGPAVLGWVTNNDFIHYFSEVGVILLMFIAGLEADLSQLKANWKSAFAVAACGVAVPFFGIFAVAEIFSLPAPLAWFLGVAFSATSVSITVQILKEMDKLNSPEGSTILGAAVVDDVLVVILLAVVASLLGSGGEEALPLLIGKKLLFFAVVLVVGWLVVPRLMALLAKLRITEPLVTAALIICFGFAYFADLMGMAGIIGSFAAGIAVSQTTFREKVTAKVEPIAYSLFVPVFFAGIGLQVSFAGVGNQLAFVLTLTVAAVLTKWLGGALGAGLTGFGRSSSLAIGSGMVSRGEVALIIAATGLQTGLLIPEYFTSVVLVIIATTLIAPLMMKLAFADGAKGSQSPKVRERS